MLQKLVQQMNLKLFYKNIKMLPDCLEIVQLQVIKCPKTIGVIYLMTN